MGDRGLLSGRRVGVMRNVFVRRWYRRQLIWRLFVTIGLLTSLRLHGLSSRCVDWFEGRLWVELVSGGHGELCDEPVVSGTIDV